MSLQSETKAQAIHNILQTAELHDEDTWTDPITVSDGDFALSITGTFDGTITVQVMPVWRDCDPVDWADDAKYTKPVGRMSIPLKETWLIRAGFKAGEYNTGTAVVTLNAGEVENRRYAVVRSTL